MLTPGTQIDIIKLKKEIKTEGKKMTTYKVTGNSYKAKQVLKDAGFKWIAEKKSWVGSEEAVAEFKRITHPTYSRANQNAVTEWVPAAGQYQLVVKFEEI